MNANRLSCILMIFLYIKKYQDQNGLAKNNKQHMNEVLSLNCYRYLYYNGFPASLKNMVIYGRPQALVQTRINDN